MASRKIKVCGMRESKNILDVAALAPDLMGFIFYSKSKRFVGNEFSIPKEFPKQIKKVGVFVDEPIDIVLSLIKKHSLDYVQLHGNESAEYCRTLSSEARIIKAVQIGADFDFDFLKQFYNSSAYFLFDTKSERFGGSGKSFDWNLLQKYSGDVPFFLSGGLSSQNINEAEKITHPYLIGYDFNSKMESAPGLKDTAKLNSIFKLLNSKIQ